MECEGACVGHVGPHRSCPGLLCQVSLGSQGRMWGRRRMRADLDWAGPLWLPCGEHMTAGKARSRDRHESTALVQAGDIQRFGLGRIGAVGEEGSGVGCL